MFLWLLGIEVKGGWALLRELGMSKVANDV